MNKRLRSAKKLLSPKKIRRRVWIKQLYIKAIMELREGPNKPTEWTEISKEVEWKGFKETFKAHVKFDSHNMLLKIHKRDLF